MRRALVRQTCAFVNAWNLTENVSSLPCIQYLLYGGARARLSNAHYKLEAT